MSRRNAVRSAGALCAIFLVWFLYAELAPAKRADYSRPRIARLRNAANVIGAISSYEHEHGRLPEKLSELAPKYIAPDIMWYLFPVRSFVDKAWKDECKTNGLTRIDEEGAFVYLGMRGLQNNLVLYERPALWPTNRDFAVIITASSNLQMTMLSATDIETRLRKINDRVKQ